MKWDCGTVRVLMRVESSAWLPREMLRAEENSDPVLTTPKEDDPCAAAAEDVGSFFARR